MQERLDDHYNGENSIKAQEKRRAKAKHLSKKAKTKRKLERLAAEREAALSTEDAATANTNDVPSNDTTGVLIDNSVDKQISDRDNSD